MKFECTIFPAVNTIIENRPWKLGSHQQHDKSGLCWCIIVCNPINHGMKKWFCNPVSKNTTYILIRKNFFCLLIHYKFAFCTCTLLAPVFAHKYCTCQNCKTIGKVKMETTGMWGLTLIILKDIKCFQIWAYFEGICINFNFENFQNKIFPLFNLRTIQSMHARYHRTLQHLSKIEGWFVYTSFSLKC